MKVFKKLLSALLVAVMLLSAAPLSESSFKTVANAATVGLDSFEDYDVGMGYCAGYTYVRYKDQIMLYEVSDSINGDVVIPSMLDGDSVTGIMPQLFYNNDDVTSITLPDSITFIGEEAFTRSGFYDDETNWENGTLYIGDYLIEAKGISGEYTVKEGTTTIAVGAFVDCFGMTSLTIPDSVTSVSSGSLWAPIFAESGMETRILNGDNNLINIKVSENNKIYDSRNNCNAIIEIATNTLLLGCQSTIIPNDITAIGDMAFLNCSGLTSVKIPGNVVSIGEHAFRSCPDLTSIEISNGTVDIGHYSFAYCNKLANITIPDSVTYIGCVSFLGTAYVSTESNWSENALYIGKHLIYVNQAVSDTYIIKNGTKTIAGGAFELSNVAEIIIPNSVVFIGSRAFYGCSNLTKINIPNSVITIDSLAFGLCTSLTEITIPDSVIHFGAQVFSKCINLKSVYLSKNITSLPHFDFNNCQSLTDIILPPNVSKIGQQAFSFCESLTSITIPKSVTHIYMGAFAECENLSDVYYTGSEEDWNKINIDNTYDGNEDLLNATIHFNYVPEHDCSLNLKHVVEASTCKKAGCEYDICTVCDTKFNEKTLSLADHTWGDWKITKEPTTEEEGSKERKCSVCEKVETETIDKLSGCAHKWKTITAPASCTVVGMEYEICTECGEIRNEKTIPMTDHTWSEWTIVTEPTTTSEGLKERTCKVCGKTETETIAKLKALIDSETGIEIAYEDEFDEGTQIKVEEKFDGDSFQLINNNYGETRTRIFDISTIRDGEKVQPKGEITVRIPLPADFNPEKVFVTYVDSNNDKVTRLDCEVKDGYVIFKTDHFSYYAIVEQLGGVESVSISNVTMDYKSSKTLTPEITADDGAEYTITYSSDSKNVTIDENGKIYAAKRGTANITVTVTDSQGNTVTDSCKVTVEYTWWQWLIKIVLFGWIWY